MRLLSGLCASAVVLLFLLGAPVARAQDATPEALATAAAAFREGQAAQLTGDHARAAELFEIADDAAPSPAALRSAIRSHRSAGHGARAATLAAEALVRYPADAETTALAGETIAALAPTLGRLTLRCAPACGVAIDGRLAASRAETADLFLEPGAHDVVASWTARPSVTERVELAAGEGRELSLTAPEPEAAPEPEPEPTPEPEPMLPEGPPADTGSRGITPIVLGTLAGLTVVSGSVLIWSGVDVLSARDAYVAMPTEAGYRDGLDRELRTNVLVGVTAALGVAALVTAFFTDFGGSSAGDTAVLLVPTEGGVLGLAAGRF